MPELPEVETVRAGLESILEGRPRIKKVTLHRADIRFPIPRTLPECLRGQEITGVRRRAKYLLLDTPKGTLLSHLGMTGSWRLEQPGATERDLHDHCWIDLFDGRRLVFRDPRRFGLLDWIDRGQETAHPRLKGLGPEPLDETAFTGAYLFERSRGRKTAVKVFIMDQKIVVGVGNIYASEALFRAAIKPQRLAGKVTRSEYEKLVAEIRAVLRESIKAGGSTIRDFRQAGGSEGYFQKTFKVYDRAGEPCPRCGGTIQLKVIGGRSTFYCAKCQK